MSLSISFPIQHYRPNDEICTCYIIYESPHLQRTLLFLSSSACNISHILHSFTMSRIPETIIFIHYQETLFCSADTTGQYDVSFGRYTYCIDEFIDNVSIRSSHRVDAL